MRIIAEYPLWVVVALWWLARKADRENPIGRVVVSALYSRRTLIMRLRSSLPVPHGSLATWMTGKINEWADREDKAQIASLKASMTLIEEWAPLYQASMAQPTVMRIYVQGENDSAAVKAFRDMLNRGGCRG